MMERHLAADESELFREIRASSRRVEGQFIANGPSEELEMPRADGKPLLDPWDHARKRNCEISDCALSLDDPTVLLQTLLVAFYSMWICPSGSARLHFRLLTPLQVRSMFCLTSFFQPMDQRLLTGIAAISHSSI
jgi:hypothetical protein